MARFSQEVLEELRERGTATREAIQGCPPNALCLPPDDARLLEELGRPNVDDLRAALGIPKLSQEQSVQVNSPADPNPSAPDLTDATPKDKPARSSTLMIVGAAVAVLFLVAVLR